MSNTPDPDVTASWAGLEAYHRRMAGLYPEGSYKRMIHLQDAKYFATRGTGAVPCTR